MDRKLTVYKVTAKNGMCYIGYTGMSLKKRLENHVSRATTGVAHPFYNALREDLRKDPERYEVYMAERTQALMRTIERKKVDANI